MRVRPWPLDPFSGADAPESFATPDDYALCRQLHRQYGTTYYWATQLFPPRTKPRVHAVYGFVRVPDEWVDNPGELTPDDRLRKLDEYRRQFLRGLDGVRPEEPVLRAFCDVARESQIPVDEPLCFLDAMEMDVAVSRYATYDELRRYVRGSAAAVGVMMLAVLGVRMTPETVKAAKALGDAMQLTNFIRDVGEDYGRGRVYLPQEDLAFFGVTEGHLAEGRVDDAWRSLVAFQVDRARLLYAETDPAIAALPFTARRPVRLARELYARILDRVEEADYDVFHHRARTGRWEKLVTLGRVAVGG